MSQQIMIHSWQNEAIYRGEQIYIYIFYICDMYTYTTYVIIVSIFI